MDQIAETNRKLESLLRQGDILAVNHGAARCRVSTGGLSTDWLPWFAPRAGTTREWSPPTVGEQCLVLSPSGDPAAGFVLIGMFSDANAAPSASPDEHLTIYPDGATVRYNHASGAMLIDGIKTLNIKASTSIALRSPEITLDAEQTTSTGKHTIKGLFTYLAGMMGFNTAGGGSSATIQGEIVHTDGNLSSNGIVLHTHTHPGDSGGTTGGPQ